MKNAAIKPSRMRNKDLGANWSSSQQIWLPENESTLQGSSPEPPVAKPRPGWHRPGTEHQAPHSTSNGLQNTNKAGVCRGASYLKQSFKAVRILGVFTQCTRRGWQSGSNIPNWDVTMFPFFLLPVILNLLNRLVGIWQMTSLSTLPLQLISPGF